jgi:hypothetical protein
VLRDFGSKSRGPLIASGCVSHDNLQALNTFDVPLWMRDPQSAAYCRCLDSSLASVRRISDG